MTCPVENLKSSPNGSVSSLEEAVADLAERGVDAETFHQENKDRFERAGTCAPSSIEAYSRFQSDLSEKLAKLSTRQIRNVVRGLLHRAYVRDPEAHTLAPGNTPLHQKAKKELDLWIAAIDHRAYEDEGFLNAVRGDGQLRVAIALNSPRMSPEDRFSLSVLSEAAADGGDIALQKALARVQVVSHERLFTWLKAYDGKKPYYEDPFFVSLAEFDGAMLALTGNEGAVTLPATLFPKKEIQSLAAREGFAAALHEFRAWSSDALIDDLADSFAGASSVTNPRVSKALARDVVFKQLVLNERGVDAAKAIEEKTVANMKATGWAEEDVRLLLESRLGAALLTADRTDDYLGRFVFLRRYRNIYESMLVRPLEETFSKTELQRYATWGGYFLNRSQSGVPVTLEELDRIRRDVQKENVGGAFQERAVIFEARPNRPRWMTPSDLGLCGSSLGGPLMVFSQVRFSDRNLDEAVCPNVELMAFVPTENLPDHAAGCALGIFGVNLFSGTGPGGAEWTPPSLLYAVAHEAAHNAWFRDHFESHPERLGFLDPNERRAYAEGYGYLSKAVQNAPVAPVDASTLTPFFSQGELTVRLSNQRLGLDPENFDPMAWSPEWDGRTVREHLFQPGQLANDFLRHHYVTSTFGEIDPGLLRRSGTAYFGLVIQNAKLLGFEKEDAGVAHRFLISAQNRESGMAWANARDPLNFGTKTVDFPARYFLKNHPFTRLYNELRRAAAQDPVQIIDADQDAWLKMQDETMLRLIEFERLRTIGNKK